MDGLKVCFAGVGSIARRHIRNLRTIAAAQGFDLRIDAWRRSDAVAPDGVDAVYREVDLIPEDYDAVFITNPTEAHLDALRRLHGKGKNFFIEKPVVSLTQLEAARQFRLRDDAVYYVAGPLRYNAVIRYVRENVRPEDVISVRSISSSYLPDWRPGQDYRTTYSAQKALGGGVSIDLIHEWDYLTDLFGWPEKVFSLRGKKSPLEIDSEDYAIYIAEYKDRIAELHLDYFGRKTIRELELFTKDDTILGDLVNNRVTFLKEGRTIDFREERDDYQRRELEHFLDLIRGAVPKEDGFHHGIRVLELTQGEIR